MGPVEAQLLEGLRFRGGRICAERHLSKWMNSESRLFSDPEIQLQEMPEPLPVSSLPTPRVGEGGVNVSHLLTHVGDCENG